MSRSSCRATVVNTVTATGKTKEKIVHEKYADERLFTMLIITITKKLIKTQRQCLSLHLVPAYRRPGSGVHVCTVAVAYAAITTDSAPSRSVPIARHARCPRRHLYIRMRFNCSPSPRTLGFESAKNRRKTYLLRNREICPFPELKKKKIF